jgi:hypothetical protein
MRQLTGGRRPANRASTHAKTSSLELDDRFVDIAAGGFDAVIRHGPVGDGRLVA